MAGYVLRRPSPPPRASSPDAEALRPTSPTAERPCSRWTPRFSGQNGVCVSLCHFRMRVCSVCVCSSVSVCSSVCEMAWPFIVKKGGSSQYVHGSISACVISQLPNLAISISFHMLYMWFHPCYTDRSPFQFGMIQRDHFPRILVYTCNLYMVKHR